jgi:hypothetical protein
MSIDTAMDRLRTANPAPDTRLLRDESEDLAALLSAIWRTSTDTQTQQPQHLESSQGERRGGWLVAAAAFAIVMLVGIVVALTGRTDSIPPADPEPGTTTTVGVPIVGSIAFETNRDGNFEVYVMDADGSNPINLTNNPGVDGVVTPAWSPDGTRIAFGRNLESGTDVYVMDADGSNPINLTNTIGNEVVGTWSPDGTHIGFQANRDGDLEVYVMDADGSNQVNLTNNSGNEASDWDSAPAWSPTP